MSTAATKTPVKKSTKAPAKKTRALDKTLPLKPRMSEKAYGLSLSQNTYVFDVPTSANKATVTTGVQDQFGVEVKDVRLMILKGKAKTWRQKRARSKQGRRPDVKKAYVSLQDGHKINIFGEEEKKSKKKTADDIAKKPINDQPQNASKTKGGLRRAFSRSTRHVQDKGGDK